MHPIGQMTSICNSQVVRPFCCMLYCHGSMWWLHHKAEMACLSLQPGDCVILNAANSTTGQAIIQLCKVLRLRVVAIVRNPDEVGAWLEELGATVVMSDTAPIRVRSCPSTLLQVCGRGVWVTKGSWRQNTITPAILPSHRDN
jgi:hypothetical protein